MSILFFTFCEYFFLSFFLLNDIIIMRCEI
nr:MAG TPA: hypothetical protein [Caudoviricetes sp.]